MGGFAFLWGEEVGGEVFLLGFFGEEEGEGVGVCWS